MLNTRLGTVRPTPCLSDQHHIADRPYVYFYTPSPRSTRHSPGRRYAAERETDDCKCRPDPSRLQHSHGWDSPRIDRSLDERAVHDGWGDRSSGRGSAPRIQGDVRPWVVPRGVPTVDATREARERGTRLEIRGFVDFGARREKHRMLVLYCTVL